MTSANRALECLYLDRGDAVNLASNIRGRDACLVTDKGIDMLAEAVLRMDEALLRLYPVLDEIEEFLAGRADADGTQDGYRPNRAMQLYTALQEARKCR